MNPLPLFYYELVHQLEPFAPIQAHEPFSLGGKDFLGVQPSAWESSEQSWDNGDLPYPQTIAQTGDLRGYGKWHGPGALHAHVGDLWLTVGGIGALGEKLDHDLMAVIDQEQGAQANLRLRFEVSNPGFVPFSGGTIRIVVQDVAGAPVPQINDIAASAREASLPPLSGHSIIWARLEKAVREPQLPPDYLAVRGFTAPPRQFFYTEGGAQHYWDYIADVGRRPTEPAHPFYALYNAAFGRGELLHRGQWSQYLTDGLYQSGPWSALRVRVGDAPFEVAPGFVPHPGAPLLHCESAQTRAPVMVHPLCLSITAGRVLEHGPDAGAGRLGGTLASRNGPFTGYWAFDGAGAELLGATALNYVAVCEASLYPVVVDLLDVSIFDRFGSVAIERHREFALSYSHFYEFAPHAGPVEERLIGVPLATRGHPGGRCLRDLGDAVHWLTEFFGVVGKPVQQGEYGQFYNTLKTLDLRAAIDAQTASGRGTVFQGHNAAETFAGRYYGWVQDKPFAPENAARALLEGPQQFLATLQNGAWRALDMAPFSAGLMRWQRLRALGHPDGARLLATGKEAQSERAIWARFDGQQFAPGHLPFRARRLTTCRDQNGREQVYALGRFVDPNGALEARWSVIRLTGDFKEVCLHWDNLIGAFVGARDDWQNAGGNEGDLSPFLGWYQGVWEQWETAPSSGAYLQLQTNGPMLLYTLVRGPLPYDREIHCRLCLTVHGDGGMGRADLIPRLCARNPTDIPAPPDGEARYLCLRFPAAGWNAFQVDDVDGRLSDTGAPNLWARFDSDAQGDDLTSYTRVLSWNALEVAPQTIREHFDICVLVPSGVGAVRAPVANRREV